MTTDEPQWQDISRIQISDAWVLAAQAPVIKHTADGEKPPVSRVAVRYVIRAQGAHDRALSPEDAALLVAMSPHKIK